jgi:hypothetical protein
MNISIMAVPLKGLGSVERILLTTKSPRIQHCTPEGLIPFIKAYGAHLSTIHVTESGVAYKALIDDKGQNPGWLFEVMDDKGSQEIVEILEHIVEEGQADMIVFEIMDGEHILTESKEFKKFYDNCPIPILFIPV